MDCWTESIRKKAKYIPYNGSVGACILCAPIAFPSLPPVALAPVAAIVTGAIIRRTAEPAHESGPGGRASHAATHSKVCL